MSNALTAFAPGSRTDLPAALRGALHRVAAAAAHRARHAANLPARYRGWRRNRCLVDMQAKLETLSDDQLTLLGFDRDALAFELAELYDRNAQAHADLKAMAKTVAQAVAPHPQAPRRLPAA